MGQSIFKGWARRGEGRTSRSREGGSPERYPTIYLRVQDGGGGRRRWRGVGGAVAWGSPEKKLGTGGPRGMAGAAADRRWGVFSGRAGRRTTGRGRRGAAVWPAQGVEVEDEPQALDFVSNGCKIDWPEMKKSVDRRVASPC